METSNKITVETTVKVPVAKAWELFTKPEHITKWYFAAEDWHAPEAENDLKVGGKFKTRMSSRDGSMGFDFEGEYTRVDENKMIEFSMPDNRAVSVEFQDKGNETRIIETFDAEKMNSEELQRTGWQAILNNFKKYAETSY